MVLIVLVQSIMICLLIAANVILKIALDKVCKEMLLLKQQVQNVEVELFYPIAEAMMPDQTVRKRMTINGAVKMILDKVNTKDNKPRIIIPSRI